MQIPDPTPEELATMPEESRKMFEDMIERKAAGIRHMNGLAARRDFGKALAFVGSEERAAHLAAWDKQFTFTDDEARELITDYWSVTEAWAGDPYLRGTMMGLIERVAPIHVVDEDNPRQLPDTPTLTIYRGNLGEQPDAGSWTLDPKIAERFANASVGLRAQIVFGIDPKGKTPTVWRGTVDRDRILGYFDDRDEQEVVIPAGAVRNVVMIAQAERRDPSFGLGAPSVTESVEILTKSTTPEEGQAP